MKNSRLDYDMFVRQLLDEVPEFEPLYAEHLADNFGKVLPHVLMGDFTRFFIEAYRRSVSGETDAAKWRQVVTHSLRLLELAIRADDTRLPNLIAVSFLEYLDWAGDQYEEIKQLLGPTLRQELALQESFWAVRAKEALHLVKGSISST